MATPYEEYPTNFAQEDFRESVGFDGDAAPKLHGKVDNANSTLSQVNSTTQNIKTTIGTPSNGTVSQDIADVKAAVDGVQNDLDNSTDGLGAIKDAVDLNTQKLDQNSTKLDNLSNDVSTVDGKVDDVKTDTQSILDKIGTPAHNTLADGQAAIEAKIDGLTNDNTFCIYMPEQLEKPKNGDPAKYYQILVDHKNSSGAMDDFDNSPEISLKNVNGDDRNNMLVDDSGTQTTTMVHDDTGLYHLNIEVSDGSVVENLIATITAVEGGTTRIKRVPCRVDESFTDHFNTNDRNVINATKTDTTNILSELDDIDTQLQDIEDKVDSVQATSDQIHSDTQNILNNCDEIKGAGWTDETLKAIYDKIVEVSNASDNSIIATKSSGSISQGNSELVEITSTEGFDTITAKLDTLKITSTTSTCLNFRVSIYEDLNRTKLWYKVSNITTANSNNGIIVSLRNRTYTNQESTPTKSIYVLIENLVDTDSTIFDIEIRGDKRVLA
jgi:archaellum component FlaC